jgi:hypothetical protein
MSLCGAGRRPDVADADASESRGLGPRRRDGGERREDVTPAVRSASEHLAKTRVVMAAVRPESLALDATGVIMCPDPRTARAARRGMPSIEKTSPTHPGGAPTHVGACAASRPTSLRETFRGWQGLVWRRMPALPERLAKARTLRVAHAVRSFRGWDRSKPGFYIRTYVKLSPFRCILKFNKFGIYVFYLNRKFLN